MSKLYQVQAADNGRSLQRCRAKPHIFRFDSIHGDRRPGIPNKRRAEIKDNEHQIIGNTHWHSIAVWVAPGLRTGATICSITQLHDDADDAVHQVLMASLSSDVLRVGWLDQLSTPFAALPFSRGQWHWLLFRVTLSNTAGYLKFWFDGGLAYDGPANNAWTGAGPYWKVGNYFGDETPPQPHVRGWAALFGTGESDLSSHATSLPPI